MKNSKKAKELWVRKAYKQKVTPRTEDLALLNEVNSILVELWNLAIEQCNTWLGMEKGAELKRSITPISLNFWLTPIRGDNPRFEQVSVVLEREMLRRLAGGFSSYFELLKKKDARARPPATKDPAASFIPLTWVNGAFSVENGALTASVGSRRQVAFVLGEYIKNVLSGLPAGSQVAQITISKRNGEFWVNFVCNIPKPEPALAAGVMAIDLGAGDIVISCSDGREFKFPARRPDKRWRKEILGVEARVEHCAKGSRAWKRRMAARRIMHHKSERQHIDHQRKLANWIARQGMHIVVGKMKTRLGLSKSKDGTADQHWGVQNTGYVFRILIFLREKAQEYGLTLLELPDPPRKGAPDDPNTKFEASRALLQAAGIRRSITIPATFSRTKFSFPQGG